MIKGRIRERTPLLTVQSVLERVTEFEVYRHFLGHDFKIGKPFSSPMPGRTDSSPSFQIDNLNCGLSHCDFGAMQYRGDCIDFVKQLNGWTLPEALEAIDFTFGLGIRNQERFPIRKAPIYKAPKMVEKRPAYIQFTGNQKFERSYESKYWNDYHFSFDILRREHTYCVRSLYIDRVKFPLPKNEPVFAYYEPGIKKVKIYRPWADKKKNQWKWRSTIPFTWIHGLENLQYQEKLVTFKSNKDRFCGLHFLEEALAVQGESYAAISEESLIKMKAHSHEQYVCFGTDPQGKEQSNLITSQMGLKHINMPDFYMPANDPAEVAKEYNIEEVKGHFISKNILSPYQMTG